MFDEAISLSKLDSKFLLEVNSHRYGRNINACFACGTCSAGCPIHRVYPEYNPRRIIRMVKLGMRTEVLSSKHIWYCSTCQTCKERCPRGVGFFDILMVLKNMAARDGFAPPALIEQARQVRQSGLSVPIQEIWVNKRKELSLRPLQGAWEKAARLMEISQP